MIDVAYEYLNLVDECYIFAIQLSMTALMAFVAIIHGKLSMSLAAAVKVFCATKMQYTADVPLENIWIFCSILISVSSLW